MNKSQRSYSVGFDLGGTKMLAAVFDSQFRCIGRKRRRTRGHEGVKAGIARISQTIRRALEDAEVSLDQLQAIGVGCPGPVDLDHGVILNAVNLGWENVPLQEELEDQFGCPAAVVNDVDAGVYGENCFGAARSARTVVGVFPGTGIGGGCVYNGEILHGRNISCMEIGHMRVKAAGKLCGCGGFGCLEAEASRLAISAEAAKAAYRGEAPNLLKQAGTNLADIRSGVLADAIKAGDTVIGQIVRDAAALVGVAVANVIHLLAPDVVVLGGGLVEAMPDLWVETVGETAQQHVMSPFVETFRVAAAELGDDAAVMGAAAWACRKMPLAPVKT